MSEKWWMDTDWWNIANRLREMGEFQKSSSVYYGCVTIAMNNEYDATEVARLKMEEWFGE